MFCERFEIAERYKTSLMKEKDAADKIIYVINHRQQLRPSEIYWLLNERSHEGLLYMIAMSRKKTAQKAISHYVTHLRNVSTAVNGGDLKKMGYKTGPIYKTILNHLLEARLDGFIKSRVEEIQFVKRHYPLAKI